MKKIALSIALSTMIISTAHSDTEVNTQQLVDESRQIIMGFGKSLKGELKTALKTGGLQNGIKTCNTIAPALAKQVSINDVEVSRTSLKLRNPENKPDEWEMTVLKQFEDRKAKGESPKKMEHSEVVDSNGEKYFRYMKAIAIGETCLNCHGEKVQAPVAENINRLYPDDKALGYKLGDVRGAFSLTKKL